MRRRRRAATGNRTCVGCRRAAAPVELVRVAAAPGGTLRIGPGAGRGAWLCPGSVACFDEATRRGRLARALRRRITTEEVTDLRERLLKT